MDSFEQDVKSSLEMALTDISQASSYLAAVDQIAEEAKTLPPDETAEIFWVVTRSTLLEAALLRIWRISVDTGPDSYSLRRTMQKIRSKPDYFTRNAISIRRRELGFDDDFAYQDFDDRLRAVQRALSSKSVADALAQIDAWRTTRVAHRLNKPLHRKLVVADLKILRKDWETALEGVCRAYNELRALFDGSAADCRGQSLMEPEIRASTARVFLGQQEKSD